MKKFIFIALISLTTTICADERLYIDEKELCCRQDSFYIHKGQNMWINTPTVHRDETGLFTYETDIKRSKIDPKGAYEQKWKCPYCNQYWNKGTPCQNSDCPSKYKAKK